MSILTATGHLIIFPLHHLSTLSKDRGNKITSISFGNLATSKDLLIDFCLLFINAASTFYAGKSHLTLGLKDLQIFIAVCGYREILSPHRCRQHIDRIKILISIEITR
ncbi:hypothetical protein [Candidatus Steffania adelgidicola]|uniref:hypothetical protein n=1 Tax=Candidatus Steffania adelgidicola TaxID=1076626 RepID=UPI001D00F6DC|nr:hypothetical protein [Candidatus Steffania adelgidicola]